MERITFTVQPSVQWTPSHLWGAGQKCCLPRGDELFQRDVEQRQNPEGFGSFPALCQRSFLLRMEGELISFSRQLFQPTPRREEAEMQADEQRVGTVKIRSTGFLRWLGKVLGCPAQVTHNLCSEDEKPAWILVGRKFSS